jgi:hypothetical protein
VKDFDRYYGLVVVSGSLGSSNHYMLLYRDLEAETDIEAWRFVVLREDTDIRPVITSWLTFGPNHGWVPL